MQSLKQIIKPTVLFTALGLATFSAQAMQVPGPLVDTSWLANNQNNVVILDARKNTNSFIRRGKGGGKVAGVQACGAKSGGGGKVFGHIPGSTMVDWKAIAPTQKGQLHNELPGKQAFEKLMQSKGVNKGDAIVVSNRGQNAKEVAFATRLYWTIKYYGYDNVALLDGGTAKWAAEKRKVEYGRSKPGKGNWTAGAERRELLASIDDVQKAVDSKGQIIDPLPMPLYLGLKLKKGVVPKKGHIAGAKNMPFGVLVHGGPGGATFYSKPELKQVSSAIGIDPNKPAITHCNTGHIASLGWFVMSELLGDKQTRLYDGSMEEWSSDPSRKVVSFEME